MLCLSLILTQARMLNTYLTDNKLSPPKIELHYPQLSVLRTKSHIISFSAIFTQKTSNSSGCPKVPMSVWGTLVWGSVVCCKSRSGDADAAASTLATAQSLLDPAVDNISTHHLLLSYFVNLWINLGGWPLKEMQERCILVVEIVLVRKYAINIYII